MSNTSEKIVINREWAMPSSKTFLIRPIKDFIIKILDNVNGILIDPFANECSIKGNLSDNLKYISNDLDVNYDTDYHMDATEFLHMFNDNSIDAILYDPPYSPRQVSESYKKLDMSVNMATTQSSYWSKQKKEIARILKTGGKVITFGWNSGGIGKTNGFKIDEILLVAHGGWHNDTICTSETKVFQHKN